MKEKQKQQQGQRRAKKEFLPFFALVAVFASILDSTLKRWRLCALCLLIFCLDVSAQTLTRLAVLDLVGDERGETASLLRSLAKQSESPSFELIEEDLTRLAARGVGYAGSLNLSRDEARALGQSLGCDFYLLGKVLVTRRAASGEQFYFDSLSGLFIVEARTGALVLFAFERAQSPSEQEAHAQLKELVKRGWTRCANAIVSAREKRVAEIENIAHSRAPIIEIFSDDLETQGIRSPIFSQRLKPDYTEQADLAGIIATVELEAVFGEIVRKRNAGLGFAQRRGDFLCVIADGRNDTQTCDNNPSHVDDLFKNVFVFGAV